MRTPEYTNATREEGKDYSLYRLRMPAASSLIFFDRLKAMRPGAGMVYDTIGASEYIVDAIISEEELLILTLSVEGIKSDWLQEWKI